MVKFTRERVNGRFVVTVHVIPAMNLNRQVRHPRPFVYHPEQFPEVAKFNPEPTDWKVANSVIASRSKRKFDDVKFRYRKMFRHCREFNLDEFLSTSKIE